MKKALVVDDESDTREFVRAILASEGWEVHEAADGEAGLRQARVLKPSLIVLDISMPKMNGLVVFRELTRDPDTTDIPVIMLTGVSDKFDMPFSAKDMGHFIGKEPAAYVEKPLEPESLKRLVRKLINTD